MDAGSCCTLHVVPRVLNLCCIGTTCAQEARYEWQEEVNRCPIQKDILINNLVLRFWHIEFGRGIGMDTVSQSGGSAFMFHGKLVSGVCKLLCAVHHFRCRFFRTAKALAALIEGLASFLYSASYTVSS